MSPFRLIRCSLLLVSLLFCALLQAREPPPLLWRIEGSPPSYLFGSIHSAHPELNRLPARVQEALDTSDAFYGELAFDPATLAEVRRRFMLPAGEHLSERLTPRIRARINRVLAGITPGLSLADLDRLKLWALTTTLAVLEEQLRFGTQPVMDQRLYRMAVQAGKRTGGLETPAEQAAIFDSIDWEEQLQLLEATLDAMEKARAQGHSLMDETYAAYRSGEPERFRDLLNEQMDVSLLLKLKLERLLLSERNRTLADRIHHLLAQRPGDGFFFAVGAAHYSGRQSLQRLLRERGWRVRRVTERGPTEPGSTGRNE